MRTVYKLFPIVTGAAMGAMALWMWHQMMTGGDALAQIAGAGFVLAHIAVAGIAVLLGILAKHRGAPLWVRRIKHRPSLRHVAVMLAVAIATTLLIHLLHGGPTWT